MRVSEMIEILQAHLDMFGDDEVLLRTDLGRVHPVVQVRDIEVVDISDSGQDAPWYVPISLGRGCESPVRVAVIE